VSDTEALVEATSPEDRETASQVKQELDKTVSEIQAQEKGLETNFVKLGTVIEEIREKKLWLFWDHRSFNDFLETVAPKIGKGRSRLYACAGICKQLLPYLAPEELSDIGITKASAIAAAVKSSGKAPSDKLLVEAQKPETTLDQLNNLIAGDFGARSYDEEGDWFALSGIFMSEEEKAVFTRGIRCACKTDPPLSFMIDKWQDASAPQRKEVLFRWIMEFLGTYEPETEKGLFE
jgi:hypothetical protein